jgi:thiol-disulfide isomerase/thioredoxin
MKILMVLGVFCVFSVHALAVIEVGQNVPDQCWNTSEGTQFCLSSASNTVRVLLFNAGWCPPCNQEFSELIPEVGQFANEPVTFVSLSAQGFTHGASPNQQFLQQWKEKYSIPFTVAASPNNFGTDFETESYIPNVAIITKDQMLFYAAIAPGVDVTFQQINAALQN